MAGMIREEALDAAGYEGWMPQKAIARLCSAKTEAFRRRRHSVQVQRIEVISPTSRVGARAWRRSRRHEMRGSQRMRRVKCCKMSLVELTALPRRMRVFQFSEWTERHSVFESCRVR